MSTNPWATTTISQRTDDLGIFITDERSGRTESVAARSIEGVGVQSRFIVPDSAPPAPTDPDFASVSLLLHMDGSDGSTTFTDSSSNGLTVTANGDAQISTAQSKFGGASALFDAAGGDSLTVPYSSAIDLIGSDFTVEFHMRPSSGGWVVGAGGGVLGWNGTNGLHWLITLATPTINNPLAVQVQYFNGSARITATTSVAFAFETWSHVAVCVEGSTLYIATNGDVTSHPLTGLTRPTTNPTLGIGVIPGGSAFSSAHYDGYIDELRITKGVARYTADFTPPTAPFPDS